jgi:dephospho-CoA kinase
MLRVGLTGGLASGKSTVSRELARLGCAVLCADEVGHAVLETGGEAFAAVVEAFGPSILDAAGRIARPKLAAIVFDDDTQLKRLNALVHPAVYAREEAWLQRVEDGDPNAIAVVEAAILIEAGSYRHYDKVVLAVCEQRQQIERAMARDGLTREQAEARLRRQMSLEEKKRYADYQIDTSGTIEATLDQVRRLYESLRSGIQ